MSIVPLPPTMWRADSRPPVASVPRPAVAVLDGARVRVRGLGSAGVAAAEGAARAGAAALILVDPVRTDPGSGVLPAIAQGSRASRAARLLAGLRPGLAVGLDETRRVDGEILTAYGAVAAPLQHRLLLDGTCPVAMLVDEAGTTVMPIVPGRTACLRCRDLALADRDPAWPVLARQCEAVEANPPAADAALAGALAVSALAALLGGRPAVAWRVEGGVPHRRPIRPHPECGCGAA